MMTNTQKIVKLAEERMTEARWNYNIAVHLHKLIFTKKDSNENKLPVAVAGVEFSDAVDYAAACLLYHGNVNIEQITNSVSYYMVSSNGFENSFIGAIDL
jgi:hypothetical protein